MEPHPEWNDAGNRLQHFAYSVLPHSQPYIAGELGLKAAAGFKDLTLFLFEENRKLRAEMDLDIARLFAGKEVKPGAAKAYFMTQRAMCACDFIGQVYPPASKQDPFGPAPEGWDTDRICQWLMTELWNRKGDHWMKLVALELTGPFPLYGIEDAPDFG